VSRRRRAGLFALAALGCAIAAAAAAHGYGSSAANRFGELRPVVIARHELRAGRAIDLSQSERLLEVRRVPSRFVPVGALESAQQALGRAPVAPVPPGAPLLASQLQFPRARAKGPRTPPGRRPVQIAVTGAEALLSAGRDPEGERVDVIVTTEPGAGGRGRTYVAAGDVPLLGLREGGTSANPDQDPLSVWTATLALTRAEALDLIEAESFSRAVRLLPR
jgi:Flp pilus assembly protein CpaB